MKKNSIRKMAWILALSMAVTMIPTVSMAQETANGNDKDMTAQNSSSTLKTVIEKYVDAQDGKEIANASDYSVAYEEKDPQMIKGYTYVDYSEMVEQVYSHKDIPYIIGYPEGDVRTARNLSRAEAATIFYRLYDGKYPEFTKRMSDNTFKDVKSKNWFYKEVETLYNIGILEGDGKRFRPNDPITRAELAVIAARFTDLEYASGQVFSDVQRGYWAYSYIVAATQKGWLKGYEDGTFRPDKNISRMETMTLINRVVNRSVTRERLRELGVKNPYWDLVENYWGYPDVMEATIRHNGADWHGIEYNGGEFDVIVEKFVDTHGNEIAKSVTSKGKPEKTVKEVPAYDHLGYIRTITYVYSNGTAAPSIKKEVDKKESFVGDTIQYTVTLNNGEKATSAWKNVVMKDKIPQELRFVDGSVYLNSGTADYTFKDGELEVKVGEIEPGKSAVVNFKATVQDGAYDKTIVNEAIGIGENGEVKDDAYTATDEGVYINKGETKPYVEKTSSKANAQVGDKIVYTVKMGNRQDAEYKVEDAKMTDVIPEEMDLVEGSLQISGKTGAYSYDEETRTLTADIGDIDSGKEVVVRFAVLVNEKGYGKTVKNTAILSGSNITPLKGEDEIGVKVGDGSTRPTLEKAADKKNVKVGDRVTYTITAGNDEMASVAIKNAKIEDQLPEGLSFVHGSVYVNGKNTKEYTFDEESGKLAIELGNIAPGKKVKVSFTVTVNDSAYGKTIKNTAVLTGDNSDPAEAEDPGITVQDGDADLTVEKTADKTNVKVGDRVTYTISLSNSKFATASVRNAVVRDVLPTGMSFNSGSVQIDGKAIGSGQDQNYSFDEGTNTLTVEAGDVAPGQTVSVTFTATTSKEAYGKIVKNIATVTSDNEDPKQDDTSVKVEDGSADLSLIKSVDKTEARVGDTITYTIIAKNASGAQVDVRDSVLTDVIPEEITFAGNVQVDGAGRLYSYDAETRILKIELGNIAPGQAKEIKVSGTINSSAYGKEFKNTAVMTSENTPELTAESENTIVDPGSADGRASTKTVNKNKVKVGETLTYTITLSNAQTATADWENVRVKDALPEGLTFAGNVKADDKATNDYSYDSEGRILTLMPEPIAPGESVKYDFDVTVDDGMQGEIIINTAVLDDNGEEGPILGPEVIVDPGFAKPWVEKTSSVSEAKPGDAVTYEVKVVNDVSASAAFKRVYLRDVLPEGVRMIGTVFVNGQAETWSRHNDAIEVQLGDIQPGQIVTVSYDVLITGDATGDLKNTASAKGDNGEAEDSAVVKVKEPAEDPSWDPYNEGTPAAYIEKTGDKTTVMLTSDNDKNGFITYTVKVGNDAQAKIDWENVKFNDLIYFTEVALIDDSVKVDGIEVKQNKGWYAEPMGHSYNLCVDLGTIKPGEEHTIQYTVKALGAASLYETYENHAWAKGSYIDPETRTRKPLELDDRFGVKVVGAKAQSDIHLQLFQGTQDTENGPVMFWPTIKGNHMAINTSDACRTVYRSLSEAYRNQLLEAKGGQAALDALPDDAQKLDKEIQFFIALGAVNAYEFNWKDPRNVEGVDYYQYTWTWASGSTTQIKSLPASRNFLGRILNAAGIDPAMKTGKAYSTTDKSILTSRLQWAEELCDIFDRDKDPDTNGLPLRQYTDVSGMSAKQMGIINEVSNWHTYTLDSSGEEHWLICNGDTL